MDNDMMHGIAKVIASNAQEYDYAEAMRQDLMGQDLGFTEDQIEEIIDIACEFYY